MYVSQPAGVGFGEFVGRSMLLCLVAPNRAGLHKERAVPCGLDRQKGAVQKGRQPTKENRLLRLKGRA